ncbi:MAG TPA: hypothetical protein V6D17_09320 [Candidatus Obscuribacterales bacterium]
MDASKLPEFELANESDDAGWKPEDGWSGIMPGRSTVEQVFAVLGQPDEHSEMANGDCFDFKGGLIRITILSGQSAISKIWLSGDLSDGNLIPATLEEAVCCFGKLNATKRDAMHAQIFERPGVRVACNPSEPRLSIRWLELYEY